MDKIAEIDVPAEISTEVINAIEELGHEVRFRRQHHDHAKGASVSQYRVIEGSNDGDE